MMMKPYILVNLLLCVVTIACDVATNGTQYKVIIDNDGGADDAIAVFLALLHEKYFNGLKILGITTTQGNVVQEQCLENNQKFLKIARRQEVPIYKGADSSLVHPILPPGEYFGVDGLGDSKQVFTDLVPAEEASAVNTLIENSKKYEGELIVIALGPLTNIALALKLDPEFLTRLKQLYVAGGHIHSDRHPTAEFNAMMDVEAFKVVMNKASPHLVTVLPYSQTEITLDIEKVWREQTFGSLKSDIVQALNVFERLSLEKSDTWYALDPAMIACVINEDLVKEIKYSKFNIQTCGEDRGKTTNEFVKAADANVRIFHSIDKEAYKKLLIDVFSTDPSETHNV